MSTAARLAILLLIVSAICLLPAVSCMRMPEGGSTAKQFKIGSKVSELGSQLGNWRPAKLEIDSREGTISDLPADFDGTIKLYHYSWVIPDDIKPSFVIELTYKNGILTDVDWGILPG